MCFDWFNLKKKKSQYLSIAWALRWVWLYSSAEIWFFGQGNPLWSRMITQQTCFYQGVSKTATGIVSHSLHRDILIRIPNTLATNRRLSASFAIFVTTWQLQPGVEDQTQILCMFIFYYSFRPAASSALLFFVPSFSLLRPWGRSWHSSNCLCRTNLSPTPLFRSGAALGVRHPLHRMVTLHCSLYTYHTDCMKIRWFILRLVCGRVWCRVFLLRFCFMLYKDNMTPVCLYRSSQTDYPKWDRLTLTDS